MPGINIGIDLGTTSIIIYVENEGIVLSEPSVAAYDVDSGELIALGDYAKSMIEKAPDTIRVVCPMREGVISDFGVTETMLRYYIKKICGNRIFKPNIIVSMPSSVTNLERRTVLDVVTSSGAGKACVIEEPLAAAIGAGLDIKRPGGHRVADIGGGTSDIAVITMDSIALSDSVRIAGDAFDTAIQRYCRRERDVLIGMPTAERLKTVLGCAYLPEEEIAVSVKGKHYLTGMPVSFEITSTEIYLALREQVEAIGDAIKDVLERTPPELANDIFTSGLVITGGGGMLRGLAKAMGEKLKITARLAPDAINCVVKGTGYALRNMQFLEDNGYVFKNREQITGYTE
ncbi:MAG: rod shape-determining protein [Clostridia bacterium]|nr:rod shape-determining protein [Clostridia bacterium]